MQPQSVSLARYHLQFAAMQAAASLTITALAMLYEWWSGSEMPANAGGGMAVLIGSAFFVVGRFVAREGRAPLRGETHRLAWGSAMIVMAWTLAALLLLFAVVVEGELLLGLAMLRAELTPEVWGLISLFGLIGWGITLGILYLIYGPAARRLAARRQARAIA